MIPTPSQEPYLLPEEQNQYIFEQRIRNTILPFSTSSTNPRAIFLGGQSGSGKSGLTKYLLSSEFSTSERAIVINSDALREFHPNFADLQVSSPQQASFLVNPDTIIWQQKLISIAIKTHRNLILDGTLGGNPAPIQATMQMLREAGYDIQISILAIPARLSRFGIYKRYEDQIALKGSGRWVGIETHDRQYKEIPKTLALLESDECIDRIQIYTRPTGPLAPALLYNNVVEDAHWQRPPAVVDALTEGRNLTWTPEEENAFSAAVETVGGQMRRRGVSEEDIANFYRYVECLS